MSDRFREHPHLETTTDDLLMAPKKGNGSRSRKPSRKILRRLERIETLPKTQQPPF